MKSEEQNPNNRYEIDGFKLGDRVYWIQGNKKGTVSSILTNKMFFVMMDDDCDIPIIFYLPVTQELKNITYSESFEKLIDE